MSARAQHAHDVSALERALAEFAHPVAPRPEYVAETKTAVLAGRIDDHEANALAAAFVVTAFAAGVAGMFVFAGAWIIRATRRRG
ncbi:MAG: hypothetical protein K1X39_03265 [Thermoflexales bacterium]|nr:hypothetical protein [Thermoflexales bacterium]